MAFVGFMAWKYVRGSRGFASVVAWFSLIGIALGVATLIIVMSVMNGFRHELWGVRGLLRRGLISAGVAILLVVAVALLLDVLFRVSDPLIIPDSAFVVALVLVGISIPLVWWFLSRLMDRYVYSDAYDYRRALLEVSDAIAGSQTLRDLQERVLPRIAALLNTSDPRLTTLDERLASSSVSLTRSDRAPRWWRRIVNASAFALGTSVRIWPDKSAVLELRAGDAAVGQLTVPAKRSGEPFSSDDLRLLRTLAVPLGTALANARLVDRLRGQVDELERSYLALEGSRSQLRELTREVMTAQENERRRLAREIHDAPLAAVVQLQRTIAEAMTESPQRSAMIAQAAQAARELRDACAALRPTELDDLGLGPAIQWLASDASAHTGIPISLGVTLDGASLPSEAETALFRITQEALTNAARHAQCKSIEIRAARENGFVHLVVADDGVGISPVQESSRRQGEHFGILGMRERAAQVGAMFEIRPRLEGGTEIHVTVDCA